MKTPAAELGVGQSGWVVAGGAGSLAGGGTVDSPRGPFRLLPLNVHESGDVRSSGSEGGLWVQAVWALFPSLLLSPVTLAEPLSLSVTQFPPL